MKINLKLASKRRISYCFIFSIILVVLFLSTSVILAASDNDEDLVNEDILLPEETVYEDVLFAAGENVNISGQMKDDVYLAGANVIVSGIVEGDIIAVGAHIVIEAEVKGNIRAAGASVIIKGNVEKNLTVFGADLSIEKDVEIGKNLIFAGGNVIINGKINKNLYGAGGNLVLNSEILGNAYLGVDPEGKLTLLPQTNIYGNLEYTASQTAELKPGAQIQQQEKFSQIKQKTSADPQNILKSIFWFAWFVMLLGTLVVGLVVVSLFKDFTLKVNKVVEKNVLFYILKGLVFLIITPIALIILAATIIGLPLAFILGALYFITLYLAKIFIGVYLGDKIIKLFNKSKEIQLIWSMILGVVVLYILFAIPFLGMLIKLVVCLWGVGVLLTIFKKQLNLEGK